MRTDARSSQPIPAELIERWHERDGSGATRRDRALQMLLGLPEESGERIVERDLRGIQLSGEDLSGADLSDCDLRGADLSHAKLTEARLISANLQGAQMIGTDLSYCELQEANLERAHLEGLRAEYANFTDASLCGADLYGAILSQASFLHAHLEGADMHAVTLRRATLRGANLQGVDLSRADLREADLTEAFVKGAVFHKANLQEAQLRDMNGFERASFLGVDIRDINLSGAYRLRRHIIDENYLHEFRQRGRAHRLLYFMWWLTSDCGRSVWRWLAWSASIVIVFAVLFATVRVDYGPHPTTISPFYFSLVTFTTLGYGDVVPASMASQILAMLEVLLGYIMLGGLISIFVTKMSRRGE